MGCSIREDVQLYKGILRPLYRCYVLRGTHKRIQNVKLVPYDGRIWCVTVPTGFIVIRYNNKISITGNCALMCLAANSEREVEQEMEVTDNPLYTGITSTIGAIRRHSY